MTKVKFYMEEENTVFAYFPELPFDYKGNKTCYSHIGQHSACSPEYIKGKKLATPEQYEELLNELKGQGYDDLIVIDSRTTLSKIVCPVNCKYGAPMGRISYDEREELVHMGKGKKLTGGKVYDKKVPMSEPGYDKGGAYWGIGNELRVKFTKDLSYVHFYRKGEE